MKRFSFGLDRLLKLRRATEREGARQLGHALRAEAREQHAVAAQETRRRASEGQLAAAYGSIARAGALVNMGRAVERQAARAAAAQAAHAEAVEQVRVVRERYARAHKDRQGLDRLRERRRAEWLVEYGRWEQAALDEIASRQRRTRREES